MVAQKLFEGNLGLHKRKSQETRYFVLWHTHLEYFRSVEESTTEEKARGRLDLMDVHGIRVEDYCFTLQLAGSVELKLSVMPEDADTIPMWLDAFNRSVAGLVADGGEQASMLALDRDARAADDAAGLRAPPPVAPAPPEEQAEDPQDAAEPPRSPRDPPSAGAAGAAQLPLVAKMATGSASRDTAAGAKVAGSASWPLPRLRSQPPALKAPAEVARVSPEDDRRDSPPSVAALTEVASVLPGDESSMAAGRRNSPTSALQASAASIAAATGRSLAAPTSGTGRSGRSASPARSKGAPPKSPRSLAVASVATTLEEGNLASPRLSQGSADGAEPPPSPRSPRSQGEEYLDKVERSHMKRRYMMQFMRQIKEVLNAGGRTLYDMRVTNFENFFTAVDKDDDRQLDKEEIKEGLRRLDVTITEEELQDFVDLLDVNQNGKVELDELLRGIDKATELYEVGFEVDDGMARTYCEGMLEIVKRKGNTPRWFVLADDRLEYYENKMSYFNLERKPNGKMLLADIQSLSIGEDAVLSMVYASRTFQLKAQNLDDAERWGVSWKKAMQRFGVTSFKVQWPPSLRERLQTVDEEVEGLEESADDEVVDPSFSKSTLCSTATSRTQVVKRSMTGATMRSACGNASTGGSSPKSPTSSSKLLAAPTGASKMTAASGGGRSVVTYSPTSASFQSSATTAVRASRSPTTMTAKSQAVPSPQGRPRVNTEEVRKIKELTNLNTGAVLKASFKLLIGESAYSERFYELYRDEIRQYHNPPDGRKHVAWSPERIIKIRDIEDLEAREDGFSMTMADGEEIVLYGSSPEAVQEWLDSIGTCVEEGEKRHRTAMSMDEEALASMPGDEVLHEGYLIKRGPRGGDANAQHGGTGVLTRRHFKFVAEGPRPATVILTPIDDVADVTPLLDGFDVETRSREKHKVGCKDKAAAAQWHRAWERLLRSQPTEIVYQGGAQVVQNGVQNQRYVVARSNRLEFHQSASALGQDEDPVQIVWPKEVRMVRIHNNGIELGLSDEERIDLRMPACEVDAWFTALKQCFSRPRSRSKGRTAAATDASPKPRSPSARSEGTLWARPGTAYSLSDNDGDADGRSRAATGRSRAKTDRSEATRWARPGTVYGDEDGDGRSRAKTGRSDATMWRRPGTEYSDDNEDGRSRAKTDRSEASRWARPGTVYGDEDGDGRSRAKTGRSVATMWRRPGTEYGDDNEDGRSRVQTDRSDASQWGRPATEHGDEDGDGRSRAKTDRSDGTMWRRPGTEYGDDDGDGRSRAKTDRSDATIWRRPGTEYGDDDEDGRSRAKTDRSDASQRGRPGTEYGDEDDDVRSRAKTDRSDGTMWRRPGTVYAGTDKSSATTKSRAQTSRSDATFWARPQTTYNSSAKATKSKLPSEVSLLFDGEDSDGSGSDSRGPAFTRGWTIDADLELTAEERQRLETLKPTGVNIPDLPASADPRVVAQTCTLKPDPAGKPICQGLLGFHDKGRMVMRYTLLFPSRLDAYDSPEDVLLMHPPKFTLKLSTVQGFETLSSGFIFDIKDTNRRKFGIHVGSQEDLQIWSSKLLLALQRTRDDCSGSGPRAWNVSLRPSQARPDAVSGSLELAPGRHPLQPPSGRVERRGFVPRCGLVGSRQMRDRSPDEEGSPLYLGHGSPPADKFNRVKSLKMVKHQPPSSHAPGGPKHISVHTYATPQNEKDALNLSATFSPRSPRKAGSQKALSRSELLESKLTPKLNESRVLSHAPEPGHMNWVKITEPASLVSEGRCSPRSRSPSVGIIKIGHDPGVHQCAHHLRA